MHQRSYNYIQPPCLSSQSPQAIWVAKQRQLDSYRFSQAGHLHRQKISQFVTFTQNMTIENEKRGEQMMKNWEQRAWKSCYMVALCSGSFDQHGGGNHCTSITRTSSSTIQQRRRELKAQLRAVWQIAVHTCGCSSLAWAMSKTLEWCFLDSPGGASTTRGYTSLAVQRLSCRDVSNELSKLFRLEIPLHILVTCFFGVEYWLQITDTHIEVPKNTVNGWSRRPWPNGPWFMHLKKSSKSRQIVTMDLLDLMGFGFPTEV